MIWTSMASLQAASSSAFWCAMIFLVIWTPMASLQAARPWEAGGTRRIAPATCEGKTGSYESGCAT